MLTLFFFCLLLLSGYFSNPYPSLYSILTVLLLNTRSRRLNKSFLCFPYLSVRPILPRYFSGFFFFLTLTANIFSFSFFSPLFPARALRYVPLRPSSRWWRRIQMIATQPRLPMFTTNHLRGSGGSPTPNRTTVTRAGPSASLGDDPSSLSTLKPPLPHVLLLIPPHSTHLHTDY